MVKYLSVMAMVGVLAGICGLAAAQVYEFSKPNIPVNDDSLGRHEHYPVSPGFHSFSARGDTLYATWHDNRDGNFKIYFSKSTDGGTSWGRNVIVNDTATATHYNPAIAVDGQGFIYITWGDNRPTQPGIYLAKSTNGGLTFGRNINVYPTGLRPSIAIWGLYKVAVAWFASTGPPLGGVCATSTDGGLTFGPTVRMCDSLPGQEGPSIGFDDQGRVCAAWESFINSRYHILYYTRATDPGDSIFLPQIPIADTGAWFPSQGLPSLVTGLNGKVYVVWLDGRDMLTRGPDVYFAKSTNYGASFSPNVLVDDYPQFNSVRWPSIAVDDSGGVYVTWDDDRNGNSDIYFSKSTNDGISFGPNVIVTDSAANDTAPQYYANLAVNRRTGKAFVIWADERNEPAPQTALDIYSAWGVLTSGVESPLGRIESQVRKPFKVIPNPFVTFATLPGHEAERFSLYDVSGRKVGVYKGNRIGSGLSAGVYFLKPEGQAAKHVRIVKLR